MIKLTEDDCQKIYTRNDCHASKEQKGEKGPPGIPVGHIVGDPDQNENKI